MLQEENSQTNFIPISSNTSSSPSLSQTRSYFPNSNVGYTQLPIYPSTQGTTINAGSSPNTQRDAFAIFESRLYRKLSQPVIEISRTIQFSFMDIFICFVGIAIMVCNFLFFFSHKKKGWSF